MENALLIGLSRQMVLERQMDVVANNVANVNTNGFKADKSLFEEYLIPGAHEDNFVGSDRRRQLRAGPRHLPGFHARSYRADQEPARSSPSTAAASSWCRPPRGERYTRDGGLQINNQGQLVTGGRRSGARHQRPDRVPADRPRHQHRRRRQHHRARRHSTGSTRCAASCGWSVSRDAQKLLKEGSNLYSAGTAAAQPDTDSTGPPGLYRKIQRQLGHGNEPHDRGDARLHADREPAAAAKRSAQIRDRETRRRSGITASPETKPCALSIPRRPGWRPRNSTFR